MSADLRQLAARNLAAWHDSSVQALALSTEWRPEAWLSVAAELPGLYLSAITLVPSPDAGRLSRDLIDALAGARRRVTVWDAWDQLDLSPGGYLRGEARPCMVRSAAKLLEAPPPPPEELEITTVEDPDGLAQFELTSCIGFGVPLPTKPFTAHAPPILDDPAFHLWLGCVRGEPVSVAMAYVGEAVSGVYGVATVPEARRRGYGEALTWRAALIAPEIPSVLEPSPEAEAIYTRMGYQRFGSFASWERVPAGG